MCHYFVKQLLSVSQRFNKMYTHTIYKIIIMKQLWERKMIYNHEVNIIDGIKKNTLVNFNRHE